MASVTVNGSSAQTMTLRLPYRGVWLADAMVDADEAPVDGDSVTIAANGSTFVGTAKRPGRDAGGQVSVRILGGAGRLGEVIAPGSFTSTTAREMATLIVSAVGEGLSASSDAAFLGVALTKWAWSRTEAGSALTALTKRLGCTWRVLDDGKVWIGADAFTASDIEATVTAERPEAGQLEIAVDDFTLRPGQSFGGARVYDVVYQVSGKVRATLTTTEGGGPQQRADAAKMRRGLAEAGFAFVKTYAGRVTSQNADGTVEVKLDDAKDIAPLSKVPLRLGVPGWTRCDVAAGAEVLVGFDDGDESRPFATLPRKGGRLLYLTVDGDVFELGGTEAVALASLCDDRFSTLETRVLALETWGAGVTPAFAGGPGSPGSSVASSKLFTGE